MAVFNFILFWNVTNYKIHITTTQIWRILVLNLYLVQKRHKFKYGSLEFWLKWLIGYIKIIILQ